MSRIDNRLPVAREGLPFIFIPIIGAGLLLWPGWWWAAIPLAAAGLFSAWFFRDPDRNPPAGEHMVLSPADGRVLEVREVDEDRFLGARMLKVSIFMSVFNVHVNRSPISGRVNEVRYFPGKFFNASLDKASKDNEHNVLVLESPGGARLVVIQIAGLIARRIVCWVKPHDQVSRGQRFGLIRYGSRLEVFFPLGATIAVEPGRKVKAGETVLGYLP